MLHTETDHYCDLQLQTRNQVTLNGEIVIDRAGEDSGIGSQEKHRSSVLETLECWKCLEFGNFHEDIVMSSRSLNIHASG